MYARLTKQDCQGSRDIMDGYYERFTQPRKPGETAEEARDRRLTELYENDEANAMMDRLVDASGRPIGYQYMPKTRVGRALAAFVKFLRGD